MIKMGRNSSLFRRLFSFWRSLLMAAPWFFLDSITYDGKDVADGNPKNYQLRQSVSK